MYRKLIHLVSFVLVLGLIGAAEAAFDTVGVYDPDDAPHHNQVDQSGVYDSHTGNAGPENVIDLATFQALIGPAFADDAGGVVSGESPDDSMGSDDVVIANFGVNRTKSVNFASTSGLSFGSGSSAGNRLPTSGDRRFSKPGGTGGDYVFDIGAVTGGAPVEVITYFAGTLLYRDNRDLNPQVTATFSGGGTVTAIADMTMGAPSNSKDTFFGFVAPPGEGIVNVNFVLAEFTNLDDMAFITSAFVVVSEAASNPSPPKGATDVPRNVVLSWTPGAYADTHDVYFGTNFDDVNQATTTADPGGVYKGRQGPSFYPVSGATRLDFGQTYYWRIDEVKAPPDLTIYKGAVWQFTAEPVAYPIAGENITATASSSSPFKGPENTVNGSGLDETGLLHGKDGDDTMWLSDVTGPQPTWIEFEFDGVYKLHEMWVWNSNESLEAVIGVGFKDVTIEYSVNGTDYATLGTTHEFARAPGTPDYAHNTTVDFSGAAAKYIRLTANSNWGGFFPQYGLSEVRFFSIPVYAREPDPNSGATDVGVDAILSFRAGREAASHDVYLGADEQAVIDGNVPVAIVTETSYAPALDLAGTYYWRVDEVNDAEIPTTWQGDIWNLSTQEYLVVDDFESYNDIPIGEEGSNLVYGTWVDGFENPVNGSTIGYNVPFQPTIETSIFYDGEQSVPLFYDNTVATYSEVTAKVADLQADRDWTRHGIKALTLRFFGDPNNVAQQMYVKINGSRLAYEGDAENLKRTGWQMWYIDLASIGVSLSNVTELAIGFERIGAVGGQGMVLLDDIRLYSYDRQLFTPVDPGTTGLQAHYEFEGTTNDSSGNARHGTAMGNPVFVVGKIGQAISFDFFNDYVKIDGYKGITATNDLQPAFSIACWMKTNGDGDGTMVSWGSSDGAPIGGQNCTFRIVGGKLRVQHGDGNLSGNTRVDDDEWHHSALTVVEGGNLMVPNTILYVDGQQDTVSSGSGNIYNITADADVNIGRRASHEDQYFNGLIDDARIYNRVLSKEEIAWLADRITPCDKPF